MESLSRRGSSDEESGTNLNYNDEEEEQVKFLKKVLGWLSFSGPAAIGIAGYLQYKKNKIAKDLLHTSIVLMTLGFIFASILYILAHKIHGREGFVKRLTHFASSEDKVCAVRARIPSPPYRPCCLIRVHFSICAHNKRKKSTILSLSEDVLRSSRVTRPWNFLKDLKSWTNGGGTEFSCYNDSNM